jgi:S-adenosylmethionine decarboxylase
MHLIVDGYGGDVKVMEDPDALLRFLDEYPDAIGMTKITPPQVYTYAGRKPEDNGLSGFVLIAESHISIHTFPDRGYVNIDIFSCKDFNTDDALEDVKTTFGLPEVKVWRMDRGTEYSTPSEAHTGMVRERSSIVSGGGPTDG